mmetsp:Transcript_20207/g.35506  ORF Transcript_20207/g.35506 Transcript_20207/m.35506 type:complete len:204 (-) Transcript_20207:600-1211(-)
MVQGELPHGGGDTAGARGRAPVLLRPQRHLPQLDAEEVPADEAQAAQAVLQRQVLGHPPPVQPVLLGLERGGVVGQVPGPHGAVGLPRPLGVGHPRQLRGRLGAGGGGEPPQERPHGPRAAQQLVRQEAVRVGGEAQPPGQPVPLPHQLLQHLNIGLSCCVCSNIHLLSHMPIWNILQNCVGNMVVSWEGKQVSGLPWRLGDL